MKIISTRSIGTHKTYSPEMKSSSHNYITEHSNAIHRNSHGISYCLMALRCLWLKAHFAPEWWAAIMSDCHKDKLVRYMGIARSEGWRPTEITKLGRCVDNDDEVVQFGTLNLSKLAANFTVKDNTVYQGLIGINGIGKVDAEKFEGSIEFTDLDDFIEKKGGKSKSVLERFIKLGAFEGIPNHNNRKALWTYYQYKYCAGKEITLLKREIKERLLIKDGWTEKAIEAERIRQISEYKKTYPNRHKIPTKFTNWKPKPNDSFENIMDLLKNEDDFGLNEILEFELQYLGYYIHSPLDMYITAGGRTIKNAIQAAELDGESEQQLEVVISKIEFLETKNKKEYCKLHVNDGVQTAMVFIWGSELAIQKAENMLEGTGVQMRVNYDSTRGTFTLCRNAFIINLLKKEKL